MLYQRAGSSSGIKIRYPIRKNEINFREVIFGSFKNIKSNAWSVPEWNKTSFNLILKWRGQGWGETLSRTRFRVENQVFAWSTALKKLLINLDSIEYFLKSLFQWRRKKFGTQSKILVNYSTNLSVEMMAKFRWHFGPRTGVSSLN